MDAGNGGSGSLATTSAAKVRPRAAARGTVSARSGSACANTVVCGHSDRGGRTLENVEIDVYSSASTADASSEFMRLHIRYANTKACCGYSGHHGVHAVSDYGDPMADHGRVPTASGMCAAVFVSVPNSTRSGAVHVCCASGRA